MKKKGKGLICSTSKDQDIRKEERQQKVKQKIQLQKKRIYGKKKENKIK